MYVRSRGRSRRQKLWNRRTLNGDNFVDFLDTHIRRLNTRRQLCDELLFAESRFGGRRILKVSRISAAKRNLLHRNQKRTSGSILDPTQPCFKKIHLPTCWRTVADIKALCVSRFQQVWRYSLGTHSCHDIYRDVCGARFKCPASDAGEQRYELQLADAREKISLLKQEHLQVTHHHRLEQAHIDKLLSNTWLVRGELSPETGRFVIAIQDKILVTKNDWEYIMHENVIDLLQKM